MPNYFQTYAHCAVRCVSTSSKRSWYPTFCNLAGVDPSDDAPVAPLPIDPTDPEKDIYQGNLSWPGIDGKDVWDAILHPEQYNLLSIHETISLSREVLLKGRYKLLTAERGNTGQSHFDYENGWEYPNGSWVQPSSTCGAVYGGPKNWSQTIFQPCLFDLVADPREEHDLSGAGANYSALLRSMWTELNNTWLGYYHARSPDVLMGTCDNDCANKHWKNQDNAWINNHGPICGVPGCSAAPTPAPPPTPPTPPTPAPPAPPEPPYTPSNSTDCRWVDDAHYNARIPVGAATTATTREDCCRHCYESTLCVAAAWHGPESAAQKNACFLHANDEPSGNPQHGVLGCVTSRAPSTAAFPQTFPQNA